MNETDNVSRLSDLCQRLARNTTIAEQPELPDLIELIGKVAIAQQQKIESLEAQISALKTG